MFRTYDAEATRERLLAAGFAVNPMQELSRPAMLDGREVEARFHTVRFAEQPLPGIRMYFCRHLSPECVWSPELMAHPNGARSLLRIDARAAQARQVAERLALVAGVTAEAAAGGWDVPLANLRIHVREDASALTPVLSTLTLENRDGAHYTLDTGV